MRRHARNATSSTPKRIARHWTILRVELVAGGGQSFSPRPGRDVLASSAHTFAQLAVAIDRAFARWDLGHLHEFRMSDGRVIGMGDVDELGEGNAQINDHEMTLSAAALSLGDSFEYVFDLGDGWEHTCTVLRDDVDPVEESGLTPVDIVPIFGWGTLPDQYGRTAPDSAGGQYEGRQRREAAHPPHGPAGPPAPTRRGERP